MKNNKYFYAAIESREVNAETQKPDFYIIKYTLNRNGAEEGSQQKSAAPPLTVPGGYKLFSPNLCKRVTRKDISQTDDDNMQAQSAEKDKTSEEEKT